MENHQTDDIGRLLQQLDLEKTKYKVFRGGASLLLRGSTPEDAEFEDANEAPRGLLAGESERFNDGPAVSPSSAPKRLEAPARSLVDRPTVPREPSRSILESLLNLQAVHSAGPSSTEQTAGSTACRELPSMVLAEAWERRRFSRPWAESLPKGSDASSWWMWRLLVSFHSISELWRHVLIFQHSRSDGRRDCTIHIACGKPGELTVALSSEVDCSYVNAGLYSIKRGLARAWCRGAMVSRSCAPMPVAWRS